MVKRDITEPAIYVIILAVLLGCRVLVKQRPMRIDWQGLAMRLGVQPTPKNPAADIER